MNNGLSGFLDLLDFGDNNVLFQQRETGQQRIPFEMEQELFRYVAAGNADEMVAHYRSVLEAGPMPKISVGRLSKDELRHFKYMAVSAIAILCRVAMHNGVAETVAYSMSDEAIHDIDMMRSPENIIFLLIKMVYSYTELVGKSKRNMLYSKPVREGIEYIMLNLHSKISLEDLVNGTGYSKEYYAKLFKKETGQTVTDYILDLRIQVAKDMLLDGKSSREITYMLQFCSQSYFIQQFKKVAGVTPREYKLLHHG